MLNAAGEAGARARPASGLKAWCCRDGRHFFFTDRTTYGSRDLIGTPDGRMERRSASMWVRSQESGNGLRVRRCASSALFLVGARILRQSGPWPWRNSQAAFGALVWPWALWLAGGVGGQVFLVSGERPNRPFSAEGFGVTLDPQGVGQKLPGWVVYWYNFPGCP